MILDDEVVATPEVAPEAEVAVEEVAPEVASEEVAPEAEASV